MASTPTALHLQNKSQKENVRISKHQDLHKVSENSRVKLHTAQPSERGDENKDPNESAKPTKGVNKPMGISRLPVLAKSLPLAVRDVSPNHKRWEERPLLSKAQKKKTCTKPVPFSLSQPRTRNQKGTDVSSEPAINTRTRHTPGKTPIISQHRTNTGAAIQNIAIGEKYTDHANNAVTSTESQIHPNTVFKLANREKGNDLVFAIPKDLSTKLGNITLAHAELTKDGRFLSNSGGFEGQADFHPSTKQNIQSLLFADCKKDMSEDVGPAVDSSGIPRVSTCPAGPDVHIYLSQRVSEKKKGCHSEISENTVPFSPDLSVLCSILLNEEIKFGKLGGATPRASTRPSGRGASIYSAQRVPTRKPLTHAAALVDEPAGGTVPFSPDPSAFRSVLRNEGVKQGALMTPRAIPPGRATPVYSAQRVPVKKAPSDAPTAGTVSFSPDPSALRSILHNEGVQPGSSGVTTPRVSVWPSSRATSVYTARRVPVKKARAEEAVRTGNSQTPVRKWTPQRVPASQSQSVRRLNSTHKTHILNVSPGFVETQAPSTTSSTQKEEEVVQRLFQEEPDHEGNEQMKDSGGRVALGQSLHHHQSSGHELKHEDDTDAESSGRSLEKEKVPVAQPFIQAPHRQSVIVFSSGQKLLPASIQTSQHVLQLRPCAAQTSRSQRDLNSETDRPETPSKLCKTKASNLSLAMCALRRRLPPLQEMFLDEECAMYTSRQQSWPNQPRCFNPVASTLRFRESTCFVPIVVTCPSLSAAPHLCSPIKA